MTPICLSPPPARRPVLSICVPTWNRRQTVMAQLDRIARQALPEIELVVVDNGSTDGTADALASFGKAYPDLLLSAWTNEVNLGADLNYLRALELGRGHWLWLLGDDEEIDTGKIPQLLASLCGCRDLALIYLPEWRVAGIEAPSRLAIGDFLRAERDMLGLVIHKVGLFCIRKEAMQPWLRRAYANGVGHLHAYSFLTLGIMDAGEEIDLISVPGLMASDIVARAQEPRWNRLAGTMGAWRTSQLALANHSQLASRREQRLRSPGFLIALVHQLATAEPVPPGVARWTLASVAWRHKPIVAALAGLGALPTNVSSAIAAMILKLYLGVKPTFGQSENY